ncbi:Alcohol dehydrogenase [Pseudoclavibacter triregionum]|nr:Alcohol dehydrogenase [Pseudoclavibacter triregionum]
MKAAILRSFDQPLDVAEMETPTPGPHQALVRLVASGVCHTDLHASEGDWPVKPAPPFVPGHEGVGVVEAVGPEVDDLAVGDLVGNAWLWSACGKCEYCRKGRETLCVSEELGGSTQNGSFGEYMLVDARYAPRTRRASTHSRRPRSSAPASPSTRASRRPR